MMENFLKVLNLTGTKDTHRKNYLVAPLPSIREVPETLYSENEGRSLGTDEPGFKSDFPSHLL